MLVGKDTEDRESQHYQRRILQESFLHLLYRYFNIKDTHNKEGRLAVVGVEDFVEVEREKERQGMEKRVENERQKEKERMEREKKGMALWGEQSSGTFGPL